MKTIEEIADNNITEDLNEQYDNVIKLLQEARENKTPIDEGLFGAIFGGLSGAVAGPAIGKAFCKALGVDERGSLGNLMTSRLVLTAVGAYVGWKN